MKKKINEHDMTKDMMDIMRGGFKGLLSEYANAPSMGATQAQPADNTQAGDDTPEKEEDTLDVRPGDAIFGDELKKLQQTVDSSAEITNFKIYPTDTDVLIEGVLQKRQSEDSGVHFKMSLRAGKIETTMNNVDLTDDINDILKRLNGYYEIWSNDWDEKIHEYRPKSN